MYNGALVYADDLDWNGRLMSLESDLEQLFADDGEAIINEPLCFKAKLGIGERAFALIRAREHMTIFTEALGIGAAASAAAGSTLVAGTFFAKTGFVASALSTVGLGATAVTPIGWVLAAGVVSGAAYVGVSRFFERSKTTDLVIVPKYITTPMDIIALAIIELMLPVSLKLAHASGDSTEAKDRAIRRYYVDQWGYSDAFVARMIEEYAADLESVSFSRLARSLAEYCEQNPDCDRAVILDDFMLHLSDVIEAEGSIDEQELLQFEYLKNLLLTMQTDSKVEVVIDAAQRSAAASVKLVGGLASATKGVLSWAATIVKAGAVGLVGRLRKGKSKCEEE